MGGDFRFFLSMYNNDKLKDLYTLRTVLLVRTRLSRAELKVPSSYLQFLQDTLNIQRYISLKFKCVFRSLLRLETITTKSRFSRTQVAPLWKKPRFFIGGDGIKFHYVLVNFSQFE